MEKMFCFQCQETAKNTGCTVAGVCGKSAKNANLQDLLIYTLKGIAIASNKNYTKELEDFIIDSLFMTITNANFDDDVFQEQILKGLTIRNSFNSKDTSDFITWSASSKEDLIAKSNKEEVRILFEKNEDVRSLKELVMYGLKGLAAYVHHANNLNKRDASINHFMIDTLANLTRNDHTLDELVNLTLETGEFGVKGMALLDEANTSKYGHPELSSVNIGVKKNPGILISGHDLADIEELLEQTKGTGVDVYTHSEMLPAHYYPKLKKYDNLVGNYGNAWWKQKEEFKTFNGPILFTTNCIVPQKGEIVKKIFTTGASGFPGCTHIKAVNGKKDFSEIIELAKTCEAPTEIETGTIVGGFAHDQVFKLADKVVEAVKTGAIKQFFVMGGCDGRHSARNYYTDFAEQLPKDTVILTAGCAKYRYNKLNLGDINGIPRVLDAGQCNDSYSLAVIAMKLKEIFELEDINDLPISYNIAWYEQKAVIVLLALLKLGVKNIHLGPTIPGFLSPNVVNVLVENFNISGISDVETDINKFLK